MPDTPADTPPDGMSAPPRAPGRADAAANRERVLAAARAAFSESPEVSLSAVARRAGVGIGTLYRHFPTREELIMALYRRDLTALVELAPALLAEHPPLVALRSWCEEVARYGRLKFGVAEVIHAASAAHEGPDPFLDPFLGAIEALLRAGAADGSLKPGLAPEDVLLQLGVLWRIDPGRPGAEEQVERVLTLVVDGLRSRGQ
ncbi:TetR/AcrR family transcriptional regulator (plasmid) [Streptomyces sp. BI20]|uniref:TetR/AcrR family transcriptional regulator n=1 Tax=Streptomyces sp. BI20 TaxID=3403460 RepID=UPI003C7866FE